ncbi:methyltransferase [Methanocrinis sp.]|uniref:methyltransferase n=1 Tax=Methanocrinis sp. TaxID=3101522 RepID=UPI003D0C33E3
MVPQPGKVEKIRPAEEVLESLNALYMACPDCPKEPALDKGASFARLAAMEGGRKRCSGCGRAPLDLVMTEAMGVLVDHNLRSKTDPLRSIGWPLVEVGSPLAYPPRLGKGELIIVGEGLTKEAAAEIVAKVPEIKGVIRGGGVPGVADLRAAPTRWELLAGSDLRCDVVSSLIGELVIYKHQSKIHVEFPRQSAPKMKILEELYFRGKLTSVADVLAGPGTLGLVAALAGAERVVTNDAWLPAVEDAILNLEANRSILGIEKIERPETPPGEVGGEPNLVAQAEGENIKIEVYFGDAERLFSRAEPTDLCLIDPFPGMKFDRIAEACRVCGEIVIV